MIDPKVPPGGVRTTGAVVCWGYDQFGSGKLDAPSGTCSDSGIVSAGLAHTCGIRARGTVVCWGSGGSVNPLIDRLNSPFGTFSAVSASSWHSCGLRTSGAVVRWPSSRDGQSDAPSGTFSAVSAGLFLFVRAAHRRHRGVLGQQPRLSTASWTRPRDPSARCPPVCFIRAGCAPTPPRCAGAPTAPPDWTRLREPSALCLLPARRRCLPAARIPAGCAPTVRGTHHADSNQGPTSDRPGHDQPGASPSGPPALSATPTQARSRGPVRLPCFGPAIRG